jgi:hypothetical protein
VELSKTAVFPLILLEINGFANSENAPECDQHCAILRHDCAVGLEVSMRIPIWPWGQLNVRREDGSVMFSERYRKVPTWVLFGLRLTWRSWRR